MATPVGMRVTEQDITFRRPVLYVLPDDRTFPNSRLPIILYKKVLLLSHFFKARFVRKLFAEHDWTNSWDAGIFTFHHYHSTTHEVLGYSETYPGYP